MIRTEVPGTPGLTVLGPVRGLVRESEELVRTLDELDPPAIALGLSVEETAGFQEHFVGARAEPLVPLLTNESVEIRELARYGEVRVPNPSFLVTLEWGRRRGLPLEPVDPSEDEYADMFGDAVGYTELVGRTLRERRLLRSPPEASDPDAFILRWDAQLNRGAGSRQLQWVREQHVALRLRILLPRFGRLVLVLDRERVPVLLRALAPPAA